MKSGSGLGNMIILPYYAVVGYVPLHTKSIVWQNTVNFNLFCVVVFVMEFPVQIAIYVLPTGDQKETRRAEKFQRKKVEKSVHCTQPRAF